MAVENAAVRVHIDRALATSAGEPDFLRRLTRAFRLLQAERCEGGAGQDEALIAAEHYMFARQAVAANVISLSQMLVLASGGDAMAQAPECVPPRAEAPMPASQDVIGWGVAGAMRGEADRETWLPGSRPPPFRPAFMRSAVPPARCGARLQGRSRAA
jgi:hypothetical protein